MLISIITPSFGQLDWLKLCIASVADQNEPGKNGSCKMGDGGMGENVTAAQKFQSHASKYPAPSSQLPAPAQSPLTTEHIIQDGGTPGIEEFAREMGAELTARYRGDVLPNLQAFELLHFRAESGYSLRVFKEPDSGMYDAINKGVARIQGDLWAWLNCDEQYLPGTLAFVSEWFSDHPEDDVLCGDSLLTDAGGRALSYRRAIPPLWHHTRLVHLASLSCATFYRRSVVSRCGLFDTTWRAIGDAEWMARLMKLGMNIGACGRLLAAFAFTGRNTSESPLAHREASLWRELPNAPMPWLKWPVILHHRVRKFLAGAYRRRDVTYDLHVKEGGRRSHTVKGVHWNWPGSTAVGDRPQCVEGSDDQPALQGSLPAFHPQQWIPVLGTPILATTYSGLSRDLITHVRSDGVPLAVDFANTHVITLRRHHAEFSSMMDCIDITVPDGMPLVWAMNSKGAGLQDRVYGPTFTRKFLESCPPGMTHYLIGGSQECGVKFRQSMLALNPSLNFVGAAHGRCSEKGILENEENVLGEIREQNPDFIWVGLGAPKQYAWIARIKPQLDHGVLLAVGFAFDVNAGMKADSPEWMQGLGLGWLHRMIAEPERLLGRYVKYNTLFLWYFLCERLSFQTWRSWKLSVRKAFLKIIALCSSEILDVKTGESLGRGLILGWRGHPWVIGHPGLPPLIPLFPPQKRLTYWKQSIGFTTHAKPDYSRIEGATSPLNQVADSMVMNIILTHRGGDGLRSLLRSWSPVCEVENLWIAFGGNHKEFDALDYPRKVFIADQDLRKVDNQRGKQSYDGIFRSFSSVVERENPDYVYLCEYDQIPLIDDLNKRQIEALLHENADVMGHWLYRIDGTSHHHMLYHQSDPEFHPFWKSVSRREDPGVIFSMFGSGSFWTRAAFLAVAAQSQDIDCYLELYMPTLAHHLGYRVRPWNEHNHLISNLPSPDITLKKARQLACWTVHPVKESIEN